jgi:hypothetical protein
MLARGGVFRVYAARSWQPWPASASRTISDSSRAGTRTRPHKLWTPLARALQLDRQATEYLYQLATATDGRRPQPAAETAANGLDQLIDQFSMPAIVASRCQDVLAANPCARALSPGFAPGQNFLRWRLLDPAARKLYVDWDEATEIAVSGLRDVVGSDITDPRLRALIDELSAASQRFRELWARADVGYRPGIIHMRHPQVGELYLHRSSLNVPTLVGSIC